MKRIFIIGLFLAVFACAKTVSLPINSFISVTLEPGDVVQIDDFPVYWSYSRFALGVLSQGDRTLEGFFLKSQCQFTLVGYYKQIDFEFDGSPIYLTYTGNTATNVGLQWWVDNALVQSQCEDLSAPDLMNVAGMLDSMYLAYTSLGAMYDVSYFEAANQSLKISDYPTWNNNTIMVQIESDDGKPLDGFVYVGRETLEMSGTSVTIPLSRRSFLPTTFQISFSTRRKFKVSWWAEYHNAQEISIQMSSSSNQNQDSIYCEYNFVGVRTGKLSLGYSIDDFADGSAPVYKVRTALEGPALGLASNSYRVGNVYNIQANIMNGKQVTLAIPLDVAMNVEKKDLFVYHEQGGIVERIAPDSIVDGFVYFRTNSCSDFWVSVGNFLGEIGGAFVDCTLSLVQGIVSGVRYIIDEIWSIYNEIISGICDIFDPDAWVNLFMKDVDGFSTENWDLPEGEMPDEEFEGYNQSLFGNIGLKASNSLHQIEDSMSNKTRLNVTVGNLDVMLSELINRKMDTTVTKRFEITGAHTIVEGGDSTYITNYFATSTPLTKYAVDMAQLLSECYGAVNLNTFTTVNRELDNLFAGHSSGEQMCRNILGCFGVVEYGFNLVDCTTDMLDFVTQIAMEDGEYTSAFTNNRDEFVLKTSDVLARVALLAYYDKSIRASLIKWFNQSYKSLSVVMDVMGPLMQYNNISIKAEAAMALYEYVYWGKTTHFEKLKKGIELHYGENGGYSEGTGYLQYINEDVPYLMVALKKAFAQKGQIFELPQKFYNSGYFLKEMSRNVKWNSSPKRTLHIPLEMDDGCTYVPEYSVWGTLTGDDMFLKLARKYPISDAYYGNLLAGSPLVALGYADWDDAYSENFEEEPGVTGTVADGGAIINYRDENGDDYTITVVAENGDLWKNGQAHDQQDNMSFTLSSTRDGHIVRDMGYSGFEIDENTRGYENHNVLMRPNHPELTDGSGNRPLSIADWENRAAAYTGYYTGFGSHLLFELISDPLADYGIVGSGGSEAFLVDLLRKDGVLAYSFHQKTKGLANQVSSFEDYRSIAYFGKALWLFDQPSDNDILWVANGNSQEGDGLGTYFDEMVDVYVGNYLVDNCDSCDGVSAIQNAFRVDYLNNSIEACRQRVDLNEYRTDDQGDTVVPVTLIYPIDRNNTFSMTNDCEESNVQCFERIKGNVKQRVVVPAMGASYKLRDVLDDVPPSNLSTFNGIMFAEREGNGDWNVLGVLNNGDKVNKLVVKTQYLPSNLLLRGI